MKINQAEISFEAGSTIKDAAINMLDFARRNHCIVFTRFNGVSLVVDEGSSEDEILRWYGLMCKKT